MSLDYNISKITDKQAREWMKKEEGFLYTLCCLTMLIGIGHIDEKNWREVQERMRVVEMVVGPFRHSDTLTPFYFWEHAKRFIGLSTNVAYVTRAGFLRTIGQKMDFAIKEREYRNLNE